MVASKSANNSDRVSRGTRTLVGISPRCGVTATPLSPPGVSHRRRCCVAAAARALLARSGFDAAGGCGCECDAARVAPPGPGLPGGDNLPANACCAVPRGAGSGLLSGGSVGIGFLAS